MATVRRMDGSFPFILIALTFLAAGFVKGVIGLGLPTVAIGLLGLVMAPAQAAAILIVPSMVTNVWQLALGPNVTALARRLWPMMLGICLGTFAGMGLLVGSGGAQAKVALGVTLIAYAVIGLTPLRFSVPPRWEPWLSPVVGAVTGLVTAATGVFVVPGVPYIGALGLDREDLIQALGLSFTVSTLALAAILWIGGALQTSIAGVSLLALFPALAGMYIGQWLRHPIRPEVFRRCFFLGLLALGAHLAFFGH